jgi:hypothetical protein
MAGLWGLFGRKAQPDPNPLPGVGGYTAGAGPDGESGFPGSTSATRTFKGASPRAVKLEKGQLGGIEQGLSSVEQIRQQSYRGDIEDSNVDNPRLTPSVATPQPQVTVELQATPGTFYGGQPLRTGPGFDLAGQNPLSGAAAAGGHSQRDTTTPWTAAQPEISGGVPGSQNVRNTIAQRYKAAPGQPHTYMSSSRPDQKGSSPGFAEASPVTVESRFVWDGGGVQSWAVERRMPYTGSQAGLNSVRGAVLDGTRYYVTGQADEFLNAGQGQYGIARFNGPRHRPTVFAEPAPWSANYYDTTPSVGSPGNPGPADQAPDLVYVSPQAGRASNGTGRTG